MSEDSSLEQALPTFAGIAEQEFPEQLEWIKDLEIRGNRADAHIWPPDTIGRIGTTFETIDSAITADVRIASHTCRVISRRACKARVRLNDLGETSQPSNIPSPDLPSAPRRKIPIRVIMDTDPGYLSNPFVS